MVADGTGSPFLNRGRYSFQRGDAQKLAPLSRLALEVLRIKSVKPGPQLHCYWVEFKYASERLYEIKVRSPRRKHHREAHAV